MATLNHNVYCFNSDLLVITVNFFVLALFRISLFCKKCYVSYFVNGLHHYKFIEKVHFSFLSDLDVFSSVLLSATIQPPPPIN